MANAVRRRVAFDSQDAHTSFNVLNTLVWLPMAGLLSKIAVTLYPGEEQIIEHGPKYIDKRMLRTPSAALQLP